MNLKNIFVAAVVLAAAAFAVQAITGTMAKAQDDSAVLSKLDEIIKGQQAVLQSVESMKAEIKIIKIRVTQIQ